jgi:hypothetical protein
MNVFSGSKENHNPEWESEDEKDENEDRPLLLESNRDQPGFIPIRPPDLASSVFTEVSFKPEELPHSTREDLVNRCNNLKKQRSAARQRLEDAKIDLANSRSERSDRLDDNYFVEKLSQLRYTIKQWAVTYFTNSSRHITRRADKAFSHLTDNFASYLEAPHHRPLLIQALLWDQLQDRIFNPCTGHFGYIWAGRHGIRNMRLPKLRAPKLRPLQEVLKPGMHYPTLLSKAYCG